MLYETWLIITWVFFGFMHSLLASNSVKYRLQTKYYRLLYNAVSLATFGPIVLLLSKPSAFVMFRDNVWTIGLGVLVMILGVWVLWKAFRNYDPREFIGFDFEQPAPPVLRISGLSKSVRHPLYVGTLLVVWGIWVFHHGSSIGLVNGLCTSLYIRIGIYFEERKLQQIFGDAYRAYQRSVPMLIPKWAEFWRNFY